MVAVINTGNSIARALNYNEQKVKQGKAVCIAAAGYPKDLDLLSFSNKLSLLQKQAALNENVKRNSVHISLNFDNADKLNRGQLTDIAASYMEQIGFGSQPYLVYQHNDAGHPHIHIVTIKVRSDGSRIDMQNIGRNQSETARRQIEKQFGLVMADGRKQKQASLKIVGVPKAAYGKSETRRAITNVLDAVIGTYKYASLPELNAVLRKYNVMADRTTEGSRVFKNNGLLYRILDDHGNPVGVPVKASDIYSKPTLKYLQAKFAENEQARKPHQLRVKNAIDLTLLRNPGYTLADLLNALEQQRIKTVLRQNAQGFIYGITYIDFQTRCVFNGSTLGKQYSAKTILEKCNAENSEAKQAAAGLAEKQPTKTDGNAAGHYGGGNDESFINNSQPNSVSEALEILMQPGTKADYIDPNFKKTKKKQKRNSHRL